MRLVQTDDRIMLCVGLYHTTLKAINDLYLRTTKLLRLYLSQRIYWICKFPGYIQYIFDQYKACCKNLLLLIGISYKCKQAIFRIFSRDYGMACSRAQNNAVQKFNFLSHVIYRTEICANSTIRSRK